MKLIEDEFRSPPAEWIAVEQKKKRGWSFKAESMSDLLARPEPVISWLIENIWVDKSRGLIAGNPGVGKTWLALEMLLSVSSGLPCLGTFSVQRGATLLVEEESSLSNLARRVHSMARGRGLNDSDLTDFHHITRQFVKIPKHTPELIAFIKAKKIKLVVFDSLRRFHGVDENSSEKMQPILDAFAHINVETEASVVLIHHLSKQSGDKGLRKPVFERLRGTSDLWAWRDCILGMEGEEESDTASCSFQFRDAESPLPICIKRVVDPGSGAITMETFGIEDSQDYSEKIRVIVETMKANNGPMSLNAILKVSKGRKKEFLKVCKLMQTKKMMVPNGYNWVVPEFTGTSGNHGNQ